MSAPFMQLYVGDYLRDTQGLTTEGNGAYLLLLMAMWNGGGSLPNDARKLARFARCTPSRWAKISADIMPFFTVDGDHITQKRLRYELEKASEKSIKRAEVGSLGGKAKALKDKKPVLAKATDLPWHSPEPEPEGEVSNDTSKRGKRGTRLPDDWKPSDEDRHYAIGRGATKEDIERDAEDFRDYWRSKAGAGGSKLDWSATWRTWARTAADRRGSPRMATAPRQSQAHRQVATTFADVRAKRRAEREDGDALPGDWRVLHGGGGV